MQQAGARTRRNGTLQSCEPCRKSKLRCDHVTPICGRCLAKNMAEQCYYHPSPMTRRGVGSQRSVTEGPFAENQALSSPTGSNTCTVSFDQTPRHQSLSEIPLILLGFQGPTSYLSVLREYRNDIPAAFEVGQVTIPRALQGDHIQIGADVLRLLYRFPVCDALVRRFQTNALVAVFPDTIINAIVMSIRQIFERFEPANVDSQIRTLSDLIFRNSSRPLTVHKGMSVEQYCASFTGANFRWEAVGNYFAIAGLAIVGTPDNDPVLAEARISKEELLALVIEASDICTKFCEHPASVNEILAFLQVSDGKLKSQQYGDSSYLVWRQVGDLGTAIFAAGLHQDNGLADDSPYFLSHWRRICFAAAYSSDKSMSTFTGRPPRICARYCNPNPPLDISEEVLVAGPEPFRQAMTQLDARGWDTQTRHYSNRTGIIRLRFLLAMFREEVLEIILSWNQNNSAEIFSNDFRTRAHDIVERCRAMWDSTPFYLRFDQRTESLPGSAIDPWSSRTKWLLVIIYLDYLHSHFLLQRAVVKLAGAGHEELFETSRLILSTVNKLSSDREPLTDRSWNYSWVMLDYGLPSASVLAIELLRQSQGIGAPIASFPRTEIIRNLTVFVSSLSWSARPTHANYSICIEAERKLSQILDTILDPTPTAANQPKGTTVDPALDNFFEGYDFGSMDLPRQNYFVEAAWPQ